MKRRLVHMLLTETGAELRKAFRAPEFIIPTLALPFAFYMLFGIMLSRSAAGAATLLATYGIFAVMGPALFGFGAGGANERELGWLGIKRAAPAPAMTYIGAKLLTTIVFASFALMPIYAAAGFMGDVALARSAWLALLVSHLLAVVPFALLGLAFGFRFGANAAIALSNVAFLSLAVLGGLWFPIQIFPAVMQAIAGWLPSFHLAEVSLAIVGARPDGDTGFHLLVVGILSAVFAVLAGLAWLRQKS